MSSNNRLKREERRIRKMERETVSAPANDNVIDVEFKRPSQKPIEALNESQGFHKAALFNDSFVVAKGAAGTGKTYLSACVAADLLMQGAVKRIILTRPNVEVGRGFGFLPGTLDEKYAPYLEPFQEGLISRMGSDKFTCDLNKRIIPKALQFMRGKTFDDSIMLLDEAQNLTVSEAKMFVTRIGTNTRVFISGDTKQCDLNLKPGEENGLEWIVRKMKENNAPYEIIEYTKEDCVRSGLAKQWLTYIEQDYQG